MSVIWHDLECGRYGEDLPLWRSLAGEHGDPVLDVGAGTGRVTLDLARRGYQVTALDQDSTLIAELARRGRELNVSAAVADARDFHLGERFALCIVPMQTIQLLRGPAGRRRFLGCARDHLEPGGILAIAVSDTLDLYDTEVGLGAPLPDVCELDGVAYSSQPTAVRADSRGFVLERRRETVGARGEHTVEHDAVRLDHLTCDQLECEAAAAGFEAVRREEVLATEEYVGSNVVVLGV